MAEFSRNRIRRGSISAQIGPKICFVQTELEALQAELPQLQVIYCVWKPEDNWLGFSGTPVDALAQDLAAAVVLPDIYLCGPPALIDAAEAAARAKGVPDQQVLSERFLPTV